MKSQWHDCIVAYVDLVGIKKLAASGDGSRMMRELHCTARSAADGGLSSLHHIYAWNDSLLTVSILGGSGGAAYEEVLRDAATLVRSAERVAPAYAIAVKGRVFPQNEMRDDGSHRLTILRSSSWAMANCFRIEAELARLRARWYIDSRITDKLPRLRGGRVHKVQMLPTERKRRVLVFGADPWDECRESGVGQ